MMQIKFIIILHAYLIFRQLIQSALSIISTVFWNKGSEIPKKFLFVLSPKLSFQGNQNLRLEKIKQANSVDS